MERRSDRNERLQQLWEELSEVDDSPPEEVGKLEREKFEQTATTLERYQVAGPSSEQTRELVGRLTTLMAEPERVMFADRLLLAESGKTTIWLRLVRMIASQVRLFSASFWIASAVIIVLGAFLQPVEGGGSNSFFLVSSFVSGAGVFYALRSFGTPMARLESTFPANPVEVMTGRLAIVVFYDIVLALAASLVLSLGGQTGPLFAFIVSWLVPLCMCTLLTFVAVVRLGPWLGAGLSTAVWVVQLVMKDVLGPFYVFSNPGYAFWASSRLLALGITIVLAVIAYRTVRREAVGEGGRYDQI